MNRLKNPYKALVHPLFVKWNKGGIFMLPLSSKDGQDLFDGEMNMSTNCKKRTNSNRNSRFVKGKYGIILLILIFFIAITIFLLLYTDLFLIKEIEVIGNDYVKENEISKISNLGLGMNIFKFNRGEIEKKISAHSFIKKVKVTRTYPDKVLISIEERKVACIIPFMDQQFLYIDKEGIVVEKSQSLKSYNNPLITGLEEVSFIIGNSIDINPVWLKDSILCIIDILKENNLLKEISEIHLQEDYTIQLYTNAGSVIKIGNDGILEKKIKFVKTFILQSQPKLIVDISHGGDPVYKPRTN